MQRTLLVLKRTLLVLGRTLHIGVPKNLEINGKPRKPQQRTEMKYRGFGKSKESHLRVKLEKSESKRKFIIRMAFFRPEDQASALDAVWTGKKWEGEDVQAPHPEEREGASGPEKRRRRRGSRGR